MDSASITALAQMQDRARACSGPGADPRLGRNHDRLSLGIGRLGSDGFSGWTRDSGGGSAGPSRSGSEGAIKLEHAVGVL